MSTFDLHPKLFLTNGVIKNTGTSANLAAGELGLYDIYTNQVVTLGNAAAHPAAYIAQGSFYPNDKIGTHGGYKESVKSPAFTKGIRPQNVKRFYKTVARPSVNQSVRMFWDGGATSKGPQFISGKTYTLRLEAKGEPVLRFINRYIYKHMPAYTGFPGGDCSPSCIPEIVDAATVMSTWSVYANNEPLLSKFISTRAIAKVASANLSITTGSASATVDVPGAIAAGQRVIAAGVPYGTTVVAISGSAVTLSISASATATVSATFNQVVLPSAATVGSVVSGSYTIAVSSVMNIVAGQVVTASGIPSGTTVTSVTGYSITLSAAATASFSNVSVQFTGYVSPVLAADKAAVVAGFEVDSIYSETVFQDASFNQGDYYNQSFVDILGSLVYQNGDVCESGEVVMNHDSGIGFYEVVPFQVPAGSGELILRDFIASQHYQGIFFSNTPRDRETTGNIALTAVSRTSAYNKYHMIYTVAIAGNPSNALSHDQYILEFAILASADATAFEALISGWLSANNSAFTAGVIETII